VISEGPPTDRSILRSPRFWLFQMAAWVGLGFTAMVPPYGWAVISGFCDSSVLGPMARWSALGFLSSSLLGLFYSTLPERYLRGLPAALAIPMACLLVAMCWSVAVGDMPFPMPPSFLSRAANAHMPIVPPGPPMPPPGQGSVMIPVMPNPAMIPPFPGPILPPEMPGGFMPHFPPPTAFPPPGGALPSSSAHNFAMRSLNQFLVLGTWSAVFLLRLLSRRVQRARERSVIAVAAAQQAQLQVLRAQLNPHFLFNALNSVVALVDEDGERAKEMIRTTASLLRRAIHAGDREWTTIADELDFVELYLRCEKVRFEDRLNVQIRVAQAVRQSPIPTMLLHPLVENAVKYGMGGVDRLDLTITGELRGERVHLEVFHPGRLLGQESLSGTGTGLKSVRGRLDALLAERHTFRLFESDGCVCASLDYLPPSEGESP
jgi:hypothetical protein